MEQTSAALSERIAGSIGRIRLGIQFGLFAAGAAALVVLTYVAHPLTAADSFAREVVNAALGAVATVIGGAAIAAIAFWRQLRDRRAAARLRRFAITSWTESSLRVGRMRIPGIAVVASCTQGREWTEFVELEFGPLANRRAEDPLLPRLRATHLPDLVKRAECAGVPFTNDPCIDARHVQITLEGGPEKRRTRKYVLTPSLADYYDFAVSTARLDEPWSPGADTTLRECWGFKPASITEIGGLPAMAKVGTGTAIVTSDARLVLGVRGRTHIASPYDTNEVRALVHVVAEGMTPGDTNLSGRLDPLETARRGLHEELNVSVTSTSLGRAERLVATGFFFDQVRWQPYFAYCAHLDITWDELQTLAAAASDYWEVERLLSLPFDIASVGIRRLLTGTHPDLVFASNHAAAAVWFALLHKHGVFEMRDALTAPNALG